MENNILTELEEIKQLLITKADPRELYTAKEFAELSGMTPRRVRELCNVKGFPVTRDERKLYIHKEAFDWIKSRHELPQ